MQSKSLKGYSENDWKLSKNFEDVFVKGAGLGGHKMCNSWLMC